VICDGEEVTQIEATGAAGSHVGSTVQGASSVVVSAEGAVYAGFDPVGEPVFTFAKIFCAKAGLTLVECKYRAAVQSRRPFDRNGSTSSRSSRSSS